MTAHSGPLLRSVPMRDLSPLGVDGDPVYRSHRQLTTTVRTRLGERCARLFARPEVDSDSQTISWHAPVEGTVRTWAELAPSEQAELHGAYTALQDELLDLGAELQTAGAEHRAKGRLAQVLDEAVNIPDASYLYFVDDQPVVAGWGFGGDGGQVDVRKLILPMAAPSPGVVPPAEAAPAHDATARRRWPAWLWPLLALLMLALLLGLLLTQCMRDEGTATGTAVTPTPSPSVVTPEPVHPTPTPVVPRDPTLNGDGGTTIIRGDGSTIGDGSGTTTGDHGEGADRVINPVDTTGPDGGGNSNDTSADDPNRTPEQPGPTPTLPENKNGPGESQVPGTAGPQPPNPLVLPPGGTPGIGFMSGIWRADTGLVDEDTGDPLKQRYQFGEDGTGTVQLDRLGGIACVGVAVAKRNPDGSIEIVERGEIKCPDGRSFQPSITHCISGPGGKALCRGQNQGGGPSYKVDITR